MNTSLKRVKKKSLTVQNKNSYALTLQEGRRRREGEGRREGRGRGDWKGGGEVETREEEEYLSQTNFRVWRKIG